jgi:hypothetical protein
MNYHSILIVFFVLFTLVTIIDFRKRSISGEFFLASNFLTVIAIIFLVNEGLLTNVTNALGVTLPSNLILFCISTLGLLLSYSINKELRFLRERIVVLAQEVALIKGELKDGD